MHTVWFLVIAAMLTTFVVLDGFDLGVGILHLFVAKPGEPRRAVLRSIMPVWDGNEVWLLASGGILVFAFPRAYAVAFSGFYLPLMIVLWVLVLRGIAIEFRSQVDNPLWHSFWDVVFSIASVIVAIVLGAALGNVIRGVPIDASGYFSGPLFSNFRTGPFPGALDWYTVLVGLFAAAILGGHGAVYLHRKTTGEIQARSLRLAWGFWIAVVVLGVLATIATAAVSPYLFQRLIARPVAWILPAAAVASLVVVFVSLAKHYERLAFAASAGFIIAMLGGTAVSFYPNVLRSTLGSQFDLTVANASTGHHGLGIGLWWWLPAIGLSIVYFVYLFRMFRGKVTRVPG